MAEFTIRLARVSDTPALEELIARSVQELQAATYTAAQRAAALGPVFGVDRQLIADGTYYVAEAEGIIVGAGGWSRRQAVFGGDRHHTGTAAEPLIPGHDPARVRAFFVHPQWARRGIGRALLHKCEEALQAAGFTEAIMVATLAGEPLYAARGYQVDRLYEVPLGTSLTLPVVAMSKRF